MVLYKFCYKTILISIGIFVLLFIYVGCGSKETRAGQGEEIHEGKSPLVLKMFISEKSALKWTRDNPVSKKITEKTGVALDVEYTVGGNYPDLLIMLADRTYPDIVYAKGSQNKFIDAGAFIPLDDLIDQYGPNIKKFYGDDLKKLRYSLNNPSIYFLGSFPKNMTDWDARGIFMLQLEVVKDLGYPRLRTLEDYEHAIRTYKEKYPEIDGKPTIGLSLLADDWYFLISVTNPAFCATGAPDDGEFYIDPETYKAILHYRRPVEREYFRWLNHMNEQGLLDPESFIQTNEQYIAKITTGRILAIIDAKWNSDQATPGLIKNGMAHRCFGSFPVTLSYEYSHPLNYPVAYTSRWGIGITDKCKDPVAAIRFFDYLCSDEGQILTHWGIRGIYYNVDSEGKRYLTEEQAKIRESAEYQYKTGINLYGYPFPEYGKGVLDSTGQPFIPAWKEDLRKGYSDVEKEVLAAYGGEYWADIFPPADMFPVRPYGVAWQIDFPAHSEAQFLFEQCKKIIRAGIIKAILTTPDQFDAIWDRMQTELLNNGVEKLEGEFTRLVKERMELWKE